MPRPRVHDLDGVLDIAASLAVSSGVAAVTIRALSEATSVSNGALYHAFGSRAGLLGRAWLRAAEKFLVLQRDTVDLALNGENHPVDEATAVEAVVATALCPAVFLDQDPTSAQFLLTVSRDELLRSGEIPDDVAEKLSRLDEALTAIFIRLSRSLWDRKDKRAVELIRVCIVELPTALLLRGGRHGGAAARDRLAAAVCAVLTIPPAKP
ncbi:TetR/AcrR family transcriptional regulator [Mycolicibacterium celeriflavum]|uniref:Putative transcriptional regulator, TetR n=1 Tax=Mycolicibacterium celeriflavum TaxID=1249101 RepID=A0A1X0BRD3_MYCCF|nr:TetR/AcrR family transcriptional regulator [Mycolicibacterium celeriflavum]MCV7237409.1 helix-turn-helix transcriptional regulator [Mycolicibacterium celeriflavum]ORA46032.1 TetR family transcriptional regulator [Mycolicibacterium celeriflavum]BBY45955.1 putative transcriptional regulator, TetR [Mycolicibacterium celeriflavum]